MKLSSTIDTYWGNFLGRQINIAIKLPLPKNTIFFPSTILKSSDTNMSFVPMLNLRKYTNKNQAIDKKMLIRNSQARHYEEG